MVWKKTQRVMAQTVRQASSSATVSQLCGAVMLMCAPACVTYPLHVSRQGADEGLVVEQVATASVGPRELHDNPSPHTGMHGSKSHTRRETLVCADAAAGMRAYATHTHPQQHVHK